MPVLGSQPEWLPGCQHRARPRLLPGTLIPVIFSIHCLFSTATLQHGPSSMLGVPQRATAGSRWWEPVPRVPWHELVCHGTAGTCPTTGQAELGQAPTRCTSSTTSAGASSAGTPHPGTFLPDLWRRICRLERPARRRHTPRHAMRPLPKPSTVSAWRLVDNRPPSREGCWSRGCGGRRCPGVAATAPLLSMTTLNNCQWGQGAGRGL